MLTTTKLKLIYLVEDNRVFAEMIRNHLQRHNPHFVVKTFDTGEAMLSEPGLIPHVLILDFYLDGKNRHAANGEIILSDFKQRYPDIPVYIITASQNLSQISYLLALGAQALIPKDESLLEMLQEMIWGKI